MPPVLGPVSPSPTRLKSWAGCSGTTVVAVGEAEQRHLGAVEELLDHAPPAARRRRAPGPASRSEVTTTPLPAGQAVVLDDVRRAEGVERGGHLVGVVADVRHRGRHAGRGHDLLGEGLAALEPGGLAPTGRSSRCRAPGRRRRPRRPAVPRARRRRGRRPSRGGQRGRRRSGRAGPRPGCSATAAVPALPGAQASAVTSGSRERDRHRACSRAPDPTTRTFTSRRLPARPRARSDHLHRRGDLGPAPVRGQQRRHTVDAGRDPAGFATSTR